MRHNELCDGVVDLAGKAITSTHMCNELLIFTGFAINRTIENPATPKNTPSTKKLEAMEQKGDLLIYDFW